MRPVPKSALFRHSLPFLWALIAVSASLARAPLAGAAFDSAPSAPRSAGLLPGADIAEAAGAADGGSGPTESRLLQALPGRTLIRVPPGEMQRLAALHASRGRLLSGPALAAALAVGDRPPSEIARSDSSRPRAAPCLQPDSLLRERCLDSLARASGPRALREIQAARDTASAGGRERSGEGSAPRNRGAVLATEADADADAEDIQERRNQGYLSQFFVDMGRGGDWDWDLDDWAIVIYVVVGVIVVGAFILWGAKALYDLAVNKDDSPVFKEAALQFSYSGRTLRDDDGAALFRDAWLMGGRFAFGVEKSVVSFGLALEGGSINLSVRALDSDREIVDVRGGYLVGGPLVRFGNYRPMAFTLEFLNGTSDRSSIGWISKSRMTLAAKARNGLTYGAHLGAVFYDLRFSDGLVYRRGDFNRDLSVLFGVDAGWSF